MHNIIARCKLLFLLSSVNYSLFSINILLDMRNLCSITIVFLNLFSLVLSDRCCQISNRESPVYKLMRENRRSTMSIIARKEVANVAMCEEFAVSKKALAFNYREELMGKHRQRDHWSNSNCQALECPEINGLSGLENDTRFSYYSIYRARISPENATVKCLPRVGVFYISKDHLNYTNAQSACKKLRGTLAHIVSAERTDGLGKFVKDLPTFVGLSNRDKERIWKNEFDEPLMCFDYRGWSINEPMHSRGCVALLSPRNLQSSSSWRVLPCSHESPYVCEILPRSHRKFTKN